MAEDASPEVDSETTLPLASLTIVVIDPSLLKTWLVVVAEEEELLSDVDELEESELLEAEVPKRLVTAELPPRLEIEEDICVSCMACLIERIIFHTPERRMSIFIKLS